MPTTAEDVCSAEDDPNDGVSREEAARAYADLILEMRHTAFANPLLPTFDAPKVDIREIEKFLRLSCNAPPTEKEAVVSAWSPSTTPRRILDTLKRYCGVKLQNGEPVLRIMSREAGTRPHNR
jgi:hypothetical protein